MPAEEWQVQLVRDELIRGTDAGESLTRAHLQEACGLGSGDLDAALDMLRNSGEASEETPDGWVTVREDERERRAAAAAAPPAEPEPEPEAGRIRVADGAGDFEELSLAEAERRAGRGAPSAGGRVPEVEKRVELPIGVADALDEGALGKIVKAGIEEAKGVGASFVLVVTA